VAHRCDIGVLDGAFIEHFAAKLAPLGARLVPITPSQGSPEAQLARVDGLLIPGGADVHPSFYGEPVDGAYVQPTGPGPTEAFKLACIRSAYSAAIPMLGVCLGVQMMNVAAGGTLVQDIPTQWVGPHGERGAHPAAHALTLEGDSALHTMLGTDKLTVNSMHHQGIKDLGHDLKITARAHDGLPEGVEHVDHPTQMGVQFHPEVMTDPRTDRIFAYLVDNAAAWRQQRLATVA
jgi:gamma-glutamyl-gamma-aminobutyrate hydrolase PuuD